MQFEQSVDALAPGGPASRRLARAPFYDEHTDPWLEKLYIPCLSFLEATRKSVKAWRMAFVRTGAHFAKSTRGCFSSEPE
jgi:hypothetical protein